MPKKLNKARPWFPVSDGIEEHFKWLHGVRLRLFLVILKETKWTGTWSGWKVAEIAVRANCTRKHAHKALQQLAHLSPSWPRRKYIDLVLTRGAGVNSVTVRKALRADVDAEPDLLERMLETEALSTRDNRMMRGDKGRRGDKSGEVSPVGPLFGVEGGRGGVSSDANKGPGGDKLSPVGPLLSPGVPENKRLTRPLDSEDSEKRREEGDSDQGEGTLQRRATDSPAAGPESPSLGISDGPEGETDQQFAARAIETIKAQLDSLKKPGRRADGFQRAASAARDSEPSPSREAPISPELPVSTEPSPKPGGPRDTELEQETDPWN